MKRSIRLDEDLIKQAEAVGAKTKRSIASQVEYWAELGRSLEGATQPSRAQIESLKELSARFVNEVHKDVQSGNYRRSILQNGHAFEKSKMGPGYVDKVLSDQTRVTGRLVDGEFVEIKAKSRDKKK